MLEKEKAEIVIRRFNEIIDYGLEEVDVNLLKEAIILGEKYNIDVSKLLVKLKQLTSEEAVHLK